MSDWEMSVRSSIPRYYYGAVDDEKSSVVLGDFSGAGWRMAPTLVNLSLEHILLTGTYHGPTTDRPTN